MTRRLPYWRSIAACRGRVDLDFVDPTPTEAEQCRTVCATCPVYKHCLTEALDTGEPWGIWGGLDANERASLAKDTGHPEPAIRPAHGTNSRYAKHGWRCTHCRHAHASYERERRRAQAQKRESESQPATTPEGQFTLPIAM